MAADGGHARVEGMISGGDDGTVAVHVSVASDVKDTFYFVSEAASIAREEAGSSGVLVTDPLDSEGWTSSNTDLEEEGASIVGRVGGCCAERYSFTICVVAIGIVAKVDTVGSVGGYLGIETYKGCVNVTVPSGCRSISSIENGADHVVSVSLGGVKENATFKESSTMSASFVGTIEGAYIVVA